MDIPLSLCGLRAAVCQFRRGDPSVRGPAAPDAQKFPTRWELLRIRRLQSQDRGSRQSPMMGRTPNDDDLTLLAATAAGDPDAFERFYRRHEAAVVGFHLRRTGNRELAFDLAAETFAAVIVASGRFDPTQGSPAGWLFGIAANKLRESLRRGRVEANARRQLAMAPVSVTDDDLERVDELASLADERSLAEMLEGLPNDQRAAILARVIDERDYAEIARELACSEAVVRQRVARGLRTLRKRLEATR